MVRIRSGIFFVAAICLLAVAGRAKADVTYSYSDNYDYSWPPNDPDWSPRDIVQYGGGATVTALDFVDGTEWFTNGTCGSEGMEDGSIYGSNCLEIELSVSGGDVAMDIYGCWSYATTPCSTTSPDFTSLGGETIGGVPPDTNISYEEYYPAKNETVTFTINDPSIESVLPMPTPEPATFLLMFPLPLAILFGCARRDSSGRFGLFLGGRNADAIEPGGGHALEERFDFVV